MMMKSPGVIVPMTGATSVVEIEPTKDLAPFLQLLHAQRPFPAELMRIARAAAVKWN
jgi:hypothetical protein